jgi:CRISPR-associated endonuclease Cas2
MTKKDVNHKDSLLQKIEKLKHAGISDNNKMIARDVDFDFSKIPDLSERVKQIIGIASNPNKNISNMLFFVMYDIESDKVRIQIAKYLIRIGCTRIQRSIFLADLDSAKYNMIKSDLTEVQSLYDNHDSILIVPISTDYLQAMKVIGKSIDIDIITKSKNTLFF